MNISPATQRPKLVTADRKEVERFVAFCQMLANHKAGFDDETIGPKASAAKKVAAELLEAVKVEMLPASKRPKKEDPRPLLDASDEAESPDEDGGPATTVNDSAPTSPGEGEVADEPTV